MRLSSIGSFKAFHHVFRPASPSVSPLVNSWCHLWGSQPYDARDNSRNSFLVGLLALGEGWHNNHHKFPYSERQGIEWWQIDITHYILYLLSLLGVVRELKEPKLG